MPKDIVRSTHLSLHVHKDMDAVARHAARLLAEASREAIARQGIFRVALSGGQTPLALFRLLASGEWARTLPWEQTAFFWVDERCNIAPDDPESNFGAARRELLRHIPCTHYTRIRGEMGPEQAADLYEQRIRAEFGINETELPCFDLVLLGMGDDGHTASIFPASTGLAETRHLAIAQYVPGKADRVTLTLPVLNNARRCVFLVSGASKHPALGRVLNLLDEPNLPAQFVRPTAGDVVWLVDEAAVRG